MCVCVCVHACVCVCVCVHSFNVPLPERGNDSITVHKSQSSFDSLLTVPIQTGVMKYSYSCVVSNQFGNANSSIVITVSGK